MGLTRACSRLARHVATAIRSIFATLLSSHASCVPANLLMRITCGSSSRGRLVVKRVMNSRYRSVVSITARLIALSMSGPGGRSPASILSRLPASFGRIRVQTRARIGRICLRKPLGPIGQRTPMPSTAKHNKTMTFPRSLPCRGASLFHDPNGTAFADLTIDGHRETWPIRSRQFRHWLRGRYYEESGSAAGAETIGSVLDLLEAGAQFDAPERTVHIRVAEHNGRTYLDLADKHWRAVEIGPNGWQVVSSPPVRFRRAAGMLPLPLPQRGGSIEALAAFLNLPTPDEFVLVVAWLLATLRQGGPYPLLVIAGEQGSAKTMLTKILRRLIDPNVAPTRAPPREERDLMIAANNGHILAFDNLSGLPSWLSDALCRLASGGSFAVRKLYTDCDEMLFQAARPAILNGIEDIVCRSDLADRAIFLALEPIADERRRTERQLWLGFEIVCPQILGSLLDAAAHGLRRLSSVRLERSPRMADFALWATACETAFWPPGTFLRVYDANRRSAIEGVIEADPVAAFVREIMSERSTWAGRASDLLRARITAGEDVPNRTAGWPRNARALAGRLRRCQTFLRTVGIDIAFSREGRTGSRMIRMTSLTKSPAPAQATDRAA
jgi:hypothetical protein